MERVFGTLGLVVYTEVSFGETIIGKSRRLDVFVLREFDQQALAIECKFQKVSGTANEKTRNAPQESEALWIPGAWCTRARGWSDGVLHTLRGSKRAVYCLSQGPAMECTDETLELDHVVGRGVWAVGEHRLHQGDAVARLEGLVAGAVDLIVTDPACESLEKHRAIGITTRLKYSKASSNDRFAIFRNERFEELLQAAHHALAKTLTSACL